MTNLVNLKHALAQERINRLHDLKSRLGLSKTTIYKMISNGDFPKAIQLTERSVGWKESDIQAWIASRLNVGESAL
jgi:prophage regulatory protein